MIKFATFHSNACQYAADFSTTKVMIGIVWCRFLFKL